MDKIAANNHIVALRKEVKKAKAMVAGNLIRKINKLKADMEKVDDGEQKKKIDDKIEKIYAETKLLKTLDIYPICKQVTLNPDTKYWEKLLGDTKSTAEQRLSSRIACKNTVHKLVTRFRTDFKECDEWLEEYFEYREKKKDLDIVAGKGQKRNNHKNNDRRMDKKSAKPNETPSNSFRTSSPKKAQTKSNSGEELHPSWASKRKQKELLKAALSGGAQSKRIILNTDS